MNVRIIRPQEPVQYSLEPRRIRIEFKDGSHLVGYINIHAQYNGQEYAGDERLAQGPEAESQGKFNRTSDYLKSCNQREGVITVFKANYLGFSDRTCFVFLHSVKLIMEEEETVLFKETSKPPEEPKNAEASSFSLRDILKKPK